MTTERCNECGRMIVVGEDDYYTETDRLVCLDCLIDLEKDDVAQDN